MEPLRIMETATVLLLIAALGGVVMAIIRFSGKPYPATWLAMLHGFLAGAAVTLLLYAWATVGLPSLAIYATVLFLVAALGGLVMNLNYHWNHRELPKWLVVVHAAVAALGFLLLLVATWNAMQS